MVQKFTVLPDSELRALRRSFSKCVKPSAGSRSLTSLTILEHDPCYCACVAPVFRLAKEVWLNQTRQYEYAVPFSTLRRAWESAFAGE
eukprot:800843-Pyramimonas_sp.AAC.1